MAKSYTGSKGNPQPISSALDMAEWARANVAAPRQPTDKTWFRNDSITGTNWNQLFPYQLLVVEQKDDGTYTRRNALNSGGGPTFQFTMPMPPESFSISMPFAINGSVTLGGFVEEHNGAPIRMIQMSGTMGVNPGRGSGTVYSRGFSFQNAIFAGHLGSAVGGLETAAGQVGTNAVSRLTSNPNNPQYIRNTIAQNDFGDVSSHGAGSLTGWYQYRLLQLFCESYVEFRKTADGRHCRLALATWKDEAVYLVSPIQFDAHKGAGSPMEQMYTLNFKAYKRVRLDKGLADLAQNYVPINRQPNRLARTLSTLGKVRLLLHNAKQTLQAVGGDVERTLYEPIRQTCLALKDQVSQAITAADLSKRAILDLKSSIMQYISTKSTASNVPEANRAVGRHISDTTQSTYNSIRDFTIERTDNTNLNAPGQALLDSHPANSPFENPSDNYEFFSTIDVSSLNIPPQLAARIARERVNARNLTRADYQAMRDSIQAQANAFAAAIGAGHPTFNEIYGLQDPATTIIDNPTDDDYATLFSLNQLVLEMNRLSVSTDTDPKLQTIATVAGLATQAGIAFQQPRSKFAVPFPYGASLEQLSNTYFGTPDRWFEIATLNGLQSPYVDEVGFTLPLLVNGANNTLFVGDDTHLYVGQPVYITSDNVVRTPRTVTKIDQLSPSQIMVTVDGNADMDQYVTLANAKLEAFLPNTVNSQMLIYIPSDLEPKDSDFTFKSIPGIAEYDSFIAVGGIDLLLTPANDLVITPDGDSRWAVGLTNIVQKVRLALSVVQGTLNRHPSYGLPLEVGMSLADLSAADVVKAAEGMFAGDPTFTGIKAASINVTGPSAALSIAVEVAGTNQVIPVTAQVSR
jgi:hypothetical protein